MELAQNDKELRALKIVLMSATADVSRYAAYVKPLCDHGKPAVYAIGESATVFSTTKRYLKDALMCSVILATVFDCVVKRKGYRECNHTVFGQHAKPKTFGRV